MSLSMSLSRTNKAVNRRSKQFTFGCCSIQRPTKHEQHWHGELEITWVLSCFEGMDQGLNTFATTTLIEYGSRKWKSQV